MVCFLIVRSVSNILFTSRTTCRWRRICTWSLNCILSYIWIIIFLSLLQMELYVFTFWVPCCDVRYDFCIKTMFGSSLPPVVCRRPHVLFTLFMFVWVQWCPTHVVLCFCFVILRLVYPMLPVSLDCPFLIAPEVFANVYLRV
jgi:hypothetical protein